MAKNTGKPSEKIFETAITRLGKQAWYLRLVDASEIVGRTKVISSSVRAQPCDYILVIRGHTEFAEVKSSVDSRAFRFSLLRTGQTAQAQMIVSAGGDYMIYVHALDTDTWYRFPYGVVDHYKHAGHSSIPWPELESFKWNIPTT